MSSSSKTNTAATKHINKPPISPLILVKTKIPQTSDKPLVDFSDSDDIWQTVDSNKRIRSPITKSPPHKKADSNIFITKNRYTPISPTTEIEPMDSTNDQPTENTAETNADKINLPPPIFIQAQLNFNTFCIKLKEITDSTSFSCKTTTKGVKLQTFSSDSYRSVVKFLKNENVSFHSYQSKESKPLRVVIRNLHPTTDKDYIIKELSELETHLTQKNFLNIQDYEALRADHPDGFAHGGTVLLVSRRIPHSPFPPHTSDKLQIIATSIVLNSIPISFAPAYLPPGCQFPENELASFIFFLNHTFLIGADFNAKHLNWDSRHTNTRGRSLFRVILSSHAKTITTDAPAYWPTHANRYPEILDFFLSNLPNHLKTQTTNLNDPASDHTPVLLQINTQAPNKPSFKQINWPNFRNILSNITNLNIKLKTKEDIDLAITSLTENILLAKNNSLSRTSNTISSNHITPEISQLIIEKRRARNKWQHSHYPDDRHIYNSRSNKLKKLLKKHKNVLYESHLSSLSPNNGSLWRKTNPYSDTRQYSPLFNVKTATSLSLLKIRPNY
ncbi:hypothetical protein QTP88_005004 [Uroleucon formosanum]